MYIREPPLLKFWQCTPVLSSYFIRKKLKNTNISRAYTYVEKRETEMQLKYFAYSLRTVENSARNARTSSEDKKAE